MAHKLIHSSWKKNGNKRVCRPCTIIIYQEALMSSAIFSTASECYPVVSIIHAGGIQEMPEEKRKGDNTHYFRITTTQGAVFCHFKNSESARKARGVLGAMMETLKPNMFRSAGETIDPRHVISFGRVQTLKEPSDGMTHAFPVNLDAKQEKSEKIWLTYKSEDHATKARRVLYAIIQDLYRTSIMESEQQVEPAVAECATEYSA